MLAALEEAIDKGVLVGVRGKAPLKQHYIPEVGDEVVFVRSGHEAHLVEFDQPRRPWDCSGRPHAVEPCVVESVVPFRPIPVYALRKGKPGESDNYAPILRTNPFCCVRLRSGAKDQEGKADSVFHVTLYIGASLPDFVVKKSVFDDVLDLAPGQKVKMWFQTETRGKSPKTKQDKKGGNFYFGKVVTNSNEERQDPWECVKVLWDDDETGETTDVCPWELFSA
mmetsp:Transcript_11031/g.27030  ORF Transcript_11031/g.27030 Transcript_11031/m.27030 type:complete len:224 (-) Transcript_11031:209-880(-)